MGTRGLTKVIKDNKIIVAQYGQWDHYPAGQGLTCYYFLQDDKNIEALRNAAIYYPSDEEINALIEPFRDADGFMSYENGKEFDAKYPSLTRDTGAEVLRVLTNSDSPVPLKLDTEFEDDALFCEGIFEINLDTNRFITKTERNWEKSDDNYGEFRVVVDLHIYEDVQKIHPARYLMECNVPRLDAESTIKYIEEKQVA
jgi:hypothetical protein